MYPISYRTIWRNLVKYSKTSKRAHSNAANNSSIASNSRITDRQVSEARWCCLSLLQKFDSPSYTLQTFIPSLARDAYLAIRALNVELARIPDVVSNPTIGALRMQFWRDNITRTFAGTPSKEPVAILLHYALISLQARHPSFSTNTVRSWFMKIINTREQHMDNRPYTSLNAMETYAENTYSTLLYLTLAALPLNSLEADHIGSHVGKATGIAAVLKGLPLVAFPSPPNHHSNNSGFAGSSGNSSGRQGAIVLPLDIMTECNVKEEEIFRQGAAAPGLKDAIFAVATRANDHLIMAREMLENIRHGASIGHDFEHEGEEGHQYPELATKLVQAQEVGLAFGVYMPAVATQLWLERLEKFDFDIFRPELRTRDWRLPWRAYWAYSRRKI